MRLLPLALSCALLLSMPVQADEEKYQANDTAMIMQVVTDRVNGEIHVYGSNLVEDGNVTVILGGYELVVFNAGKGWIDAYLPQGLSDGDYQLVVLDEEGSTVVSYALTVTAEAVMGPQGAAGADGATGAQGIAGVDGTNGVDGINGVDGTAGPAGAQGIVGVDGTNGIDGTNGVDGVTGVAGATGAQGIAGVDGTNGIDGTMALMERQVQPVLTVPQAHRVLRVSMARTELTEQMALMVLRELQGLMARTVLTEPMELTVLRELQELMAFKAQRVLTEQQVRRV